MKRILLLATIVVSSVIFSGCAGMSYGTKLKNKIPDSKTGFEYNLYKTEQQDYLINASTASSHEVYKKYNKVNSGFKARNSEAAKRKRKVFYAYLRAAAQESRKMGYNYFAITNPEISNLGGFPISNFNDFIRYATLEDRKPNFDTLQPQNNYRNLIAADGQVGLRFVPVSKSLYDTGIYSLWKVSDFL